MIAASKSGSAFFETKYRESPDPWDFALDPYENSRYDAIAAALAHRRYRRAFEPGCSIGVLTQRLAGFCDQVDASDFSPSAAAHARERCASLANVHVTCDALDADTPNRLPLQRFDLVVLSEIGYYCTRATWIEISTGLVAALPTGATLLAAHWLGSSTDHTLGGDQVHEILLNNPQLNLEHSERHENFRLERWTRV